MQSGLELYNKVFDVTNDFLQPDQITAKCMEQNLDLTNLDLTESLL